MHCSFTDKAEQDLQGIVDYTKQHWGVTQADHFIDKLEQTLEHLVSFPEISKPHPELAAGLFSLPLRHHRIYFFKDDQKIQIIRILHTSMDSSRQFKELKE